MQGEYQILIPEKSPNDKRDYEALHLHNGVKVVLIHDPVLQKGACSISVGAGSLQDPEKSLGLAHFLEHMLFMGSTKFPSHHEYSSFISLHSGMDNAYTSDQQTNYFFEIANKVFPEAIERLCDFFTGALLTESCITKERQAVHEEYILWTNDDNCRKWEVLRKLAERPYASFSIGNNQTLGHSDIRTDLVEFYNKNYSANIINAVFCSSLPLKQMRQSLLKHLEAIPNKKHPGFKYGLPFPKQRLGKLVRMQSIKDQNIIEFFWVIDHLRYKYKQHIGDYITHVLGHEGKNSLLEYLKIKQYASGISSYQHDLMSQTLIGLEVKLTELGHQNYEEVYNLVIDYTSSLKAEKFIYEEMREKTKIQFEFKEKIQNYRYVCNLSSKMHYIPLSEILNHKAIFDDFNEEAIDLALGQLNPFNTVVVFSSHDEIQQFVTEVYLGAKYKVSQLPNRKNLNHQFKPANKNSFIPVSIEVLKSKQGHNIPKKLKDNVYFMQDNEFKVCKGGVRLVVYGPERNAFLELYSEYLELLWKPITYDAQVLDTSVDYDENQKLVINFFGFNDTVKKLIEKIGKELISSHSSEQSENFFELSKEDYLQILNNFYCEQVDQITEQTRKIIMKQGKPQIDQAIQEIQEFEYQEFTKRAINYWKKATFEWVIVGNFDEKQAIQMVQAFQSQVGRSDPAPIHPVGCIKLKQDHQIKHQVLLQEQEIKTSCCITYHEAGQYNQKLYYTMELLKNHIAEPFFNALRTERQLAYYLTCRICNTRGVLGMYFILVSSTIDPQKISQQIKTFVTQFFGKMKDDLTAEKFQEVKESIRVKYVAPHNNLGKLFEFIATQINNRTFYYNRKDKEQINKQLSSITVDDLIQTARELLKKTLNVLVAAKPHQQEYNKHRPQTVEIESIHKEAQYHEDNISKMNFSFQH